MSRGLSASDAESELRLYVGFGLSPKESVVAQAGSDFRLVEVA
jgi:hypothetical protein